MQGVQQMTPEAAHLAPYSPTAESLRVGLPDIADGLHSQLCELYARPTADAAERLAANLNGAALAVMRYRAAMLLEGCGDDPCKR